MSKSIRRLPVKLFYSYSHDDVEHKKDMETTLAALKHEGFLEDWSDTEIVPGTSISDAIREQLPSCDIVVFLLSKSFLASSACRKEWELAKTLVSNGHVIYRVPIIVRDCDWKRFLDKDDVKALPVDGKPIVEYKSRDTAWQEINEGIRVIIDQVRSDFSIKDEYLKDVQSADLPTENEVKLDQIFVFPRLTCQTYLNESSESTEDTIASVTDLRETSQSIVYGEHKSGKTALARHLFLSIVNDDLPVLFVDLESINVPLTDKYFRTCYQEQFNGDYVLWKDQENKTLIIDNVSENPRVAKYIQTCTEIFTNVHLFVSSDIYLSYYIDDTQLAQFKAICLDPLTHTQQEQLIRKRLTCLDKRPKLTDGYVDQVEEHVNTVIISDKIVPRYPFFVLSILQTYDSSVARSLSITSYGHCYFIFILTSLARAGVPETDEGLNPAINFLQQLALATYLSNQPNSNELFDFENFKETYDFEYIIPNYILNRLTHDKVGVITSNGKFRYSYMYYYFLGQLLATDASLAQEHLKDICANSYLEQNYLILLFAIHHDTEDKIIEDVLLNTMLELEDLPVATLDKNETSKFTNIVSELPKSILSDDSVDENRAKSRQVLDDLNDSPESDEELELAELDRSAISVLRILRNNRILGQVLRNQYGKLPKTQIEEIVETIADSSFRLINAFLRDEADIHNFGEYLHQKVPEANLHELKNMLRRMSFVWTIMNIEQSVRAVSVSGISETVDTLVQKKHTPAYDIFGYFYQLDNSEQLTDDTRARLERLYKRSKDTFVQRVLSIRTQSYMNTHKVPFSIEQSICALLEIRRKTPIRLVETRAIESD